MEGSDEGVFAWMTVNFLLGSLGGTGLQDTIPTIDLGGGSMQLTFHPKDPATIGSAPEGYAMSKTLFGETFDIYSHSYLGLGLMSAREKLFGGPPPSKDQITQVSQIVFWVNLFDFLNKVVFRNIQRTLAKQEPIDARFFA
jgi:hypothetical protein